MYIYNAYINGSVTVTQSVCPFPAASLSLSLCISLSWLSARAAAVNWNWSVQKRYTPKNCTQLGQVRLTMVGGWLVGCCPAVSRNWSIGKLDLLEIPKLQWMSKYCIENGFMIAALDGQGQALFQLQAEFKVYVGGWGKRVSAACGAVSSIAIVSNLY